MSNKLWIIGIAVCAVLPVHAQDEVPPAEAVADAAMPEQADPVAAEVVAEEAAPVAEASVEVASEEAPAEEESAPRTPWQFYAGADRARMTLSLSDDSLVTGFNPAGETRDSFSSYFYTVRAGVRLFNAIGFEGQYGIKDDDGSDADTVEIKDFYAVYLVPTATVLELFEVYGRLGYAHFEAGNDYGSDSSGGISYGLGAEFPIKLWWEALPDIRLTAGATVWHTDKDARAYGYHYGLRYDFKI